MLCAVLCCVVLCCAVLCYGLFRFYIILFLRRIKSQNILYAIHSLTHSLTHPPTHSLTHSLTNPPTPVTSSTDSSDLLGTFEQSSPETWLQSALDHLDSVALSLSGYSLQALVDGVGLVDGGEGGVVLNAQAQFTHTTQPTPLEGVGNTQRQPFLQVAATALSMLHQAKTQAQYILKHHLLLLAEGRNLFNLFLVPSVTAMRAAIEGLGAGSEGAVSPAAHSLAEASRLLSKMSRSIFTGGNNYKEGDEGRSVAGSFTWVDGVIVRAVVDGSWLLIDNVNLCR